MNRTQFVQSISDTFAHCLDLVEAKNADYAGDANPFANFDLCEPLIGISREDAILVRLLDKVARIGNLRKRSAAVLDEKIEDTIADAINYLAILLASLEVRSE
jgi:hypothetical protein